MRALVGLLTWLAIKAGVPVIPVALTGTRNEYVYGELRHWRRPLLSLTIGEPILLPGGEHTRASLDENTQRIMRALAGLLPPEYRGSYR